MNNDNKSTARELARWLRVGTLTLTTLSPVIDIVVSRLRNRANQVRNEATQLSSDTPLQERLVIIGGALNDLLSELKNNPYAQDLRKRGEDVAEELIERGSELSQTVVGRGNQLSHKLARRSSALTQDLTERTTQATHTLNQRSQQMTKELQHRSQQARHELTRRSNPMVLVAGFSVGLLSASIAVYLLIRKRLQQSSADEPSHIELSGNELVSDAIITANFQRFSEEMPGATMSTTAEDPITSEAATTEQVPFDATLVGIVNTRHYYPIETPLDQLDPSSEEVMEVIYFVSEEEAKAQGYSPAG